MATAIPVKQVFLSYSSSDSCEASLLQFAYEQLLGQTKVWTYQRDQSLSARSIGASIKDQMKASTAAVFLASPSTLKAGATQWMELAYADAFDVPSYVLLHHVTYQELRSQEHGTPPLMIEGNCSPSIAWREVGDVLAGTLAESKRAA